ncbi:hypothetical protein HK097_003791 [Rhizophlyctis rosea]|uniref:RNA polymerase II nuclear localization protein SLC7A6OS n=1 Tax=Rhizophlyctis rosea TaxID=64517 RepID=A0AAD5X2W9_9FUNG|nr:hypothetical protein HK097_003791 [Rhizophlyctis rosea]
MATSASDYHSTDSLPTILRVKRKRDAAPVDALVVADNQKSKRAKTNGNAQNDVNAPRTFRFVGTVSATALEDSAHMQRLMADFKDREIKTPKSLNRPEVTQQGLLDRSRLDSSDARFKVVKKPKQEQDEAVQYTYIDVEEKEADSRNAPPRVKAVGRKKEDTENADKLAALMPMLQDYLKLSQGIIIDTDGDKIGTVPPEKEKRVSGDDMDLDEFHIYVPDDSANISETDRVAALEWDLDLLHDGDLDDEFEDDSSDDSNAEEYYKNDYPDASDDEEDNVSDPWGLDDDGDDDPEDSDDDDLYPRGKRDYY